LAVTVEEARAKVRDSIVHTGTSSFSDTKVDRAIIAACNRFLRETRIVRKQTDVSLSDGTTTYSLATLKSGGTDFDRLIQIMHLASPGWERVEMSDYNVVRSHLEEDSSEGEPKLVALDGDNLVVYPTPDASYTLKVQTYELQDETGWTIGGSDGTTLAVTLTVPDAWVDDVLWFGARAYLLLGAPGHPDARPAMVEFTRSVIPRAIGERVRVIDPKVIETGPYSGTPRVSL